MARGSTTQRYTNFQNGLVTEATPLSYPENSVRDIDNCDIDLAGAVRRRLGIGLEDGGQPLATKRTGTTDGDNFKFFETQDLAGRKTGFYCLKNRDNPFENTKPQRNEAEDVAVGVHPWPNAGDSRNLNLVVFQVGTMLYVRNWDNETITDTSDLINEVEGLVGTKPGGGQYQPIDQFRLSVDFSYYSDFSGIEREAVGYRSNLAEMRVDRLSSTAGRGRLYFTGETVVPFYLELVRDVQFSDRLVLRLEQVGNTKQGDVGEILIRDFVGNRERAPEFDLITGEGLDAFGGNARFARYYNLLNHGWYGSFVALYRQEFDDKFPGLHQVWHVARDDNGFFDPAELDKIEFGDTEAPLGRGRYHALAGLADNFAVLIDEDEANQIGGVAEAGQTRYQSAGTVNFREPNEKYSNPYLAHDVQTGLRTLVSLSGLANTSEIDSGVIAPLNVSTHTFYTNLTNPLDGVFNFPGEDPSIDILAGPGLEQVSTSSYTTCTFFAGRLWLAGDQTQSRPGGVYYSRVIDQSEDAGQMMQKNDPTSSEFPDLLPDDGGVVYIPDAGEIVALEAYSDGVLVFGQNGIWFISGGETNFSASQFSVNKLASIELMGRDSVVNVTDAVVFFARDSVYSISYDGSSGLPAVQDIGKERINSTYSSLSVNTRRNAWGTYDASARKVYWQYNSETTDDNRPTEYQSWYDRMLVLDVRTGAYYKHSFTLDTTNQKGVGPAFPRRNPIRPTVGANVVAGENNVVAGSDNVVAANKVEITGQFSDFLTSLKVMVLNIADDEIHLGEFNSLNFLDLDGIPNFTPDSYTSYIVTGDETVDTPDVFKQGTYLHSFFERTEDGLVQDSEGNLSFNRPSGCKVQAQWDWHDSNGGSRWGSVQKAYRYRRPFVPQNLQDEVDTGDRVVYTRLKIRGKGRALNLYYESEPGKDFRLLGYAVKFTANST